MSAAALTAEIKDLTGELARFKAMGLGLNMARGKPGAEQLALSAPMLDILNAGSDCRATDGTDCRNYGELLGIPEARALFGEYLGVPAEQTIVTGSSSLNFMYDCLARAMLTGVLGSPEPWGKCPTPTFLCPVPGYDRHFSICEFLGIHMVSVPMDENGPDMDMVETLAAADGCIKGIWCVPKYANPSGITYSAEVVRRLANMQTRAPDFRIFWDNAYAQHLVYRDAPLPNLLDACAQAGNPDRAYLFGSTNKITLPGAGVAFFGASRANVDFTAKQLAMQAIGWDKLNMLRHVRFLGDMAGIRRQMEKHAAILRPRFDAVVDALEKELSPTGTGRFTRPDGGYFVAYQAPNGCAKRIVGLCKEAGVALTAAGATHPHGQDPEDSFIRIAPSFPPLEELKTAMAVFCTAAKLAAAEKALSLAAQ